MHVVISLTLGTLNFYSLLAWMTSLQLFTLKVETCRLEKRYKRRKRFGARSVKRECLLIKNVQIPPLISHTYARSLSIR